MKLHGEEIRNNTPSKSRVWYQTPTAHGGRARAGPPGLQHKPSLQSSPSRAGKKQETFLSSCELEERKLSFRKLTFLRARPRQCLFCAERSAEGVGATVLYPPVLSLFFKGATGGVL